MTHKSWKLLTCDKNFTILSEFEIDFITCWNHHNINHECLFSGHFILILNMYCHFEMEIWQDEDQLNGGQFLRENLLDGLGWDQDCTLSTVNQSLSDGSSNSILFATYLNAMLGKYSRWSRNWLSFTTN